MSILALLLSAFPLFVGLYYEWGVSLSVICLTAILFWNIYKRRRLTLYLSVYSVPVAIIFICSIVSLFSGISAGIGIYGVIRMVGVLELVLILMQLETGSALISYMPWAGGIYFLISLLFFIRTSSRGFVYIDGRFAGLMGYANVTAAFFLISLICENICPVLPDKRIGKVLSILHPLLMSFGILWTGSRLTAVLLLFFWIYILFSKSEDMIKNFLIGAGGMAAVAVYLSNTGRQTSIGRFREIFQANTSTLIRPAYWLDAVRALIKRPFGFGFEGFYMSLGAVQSGPYFVRWLHNSFLECAYSFGWIAGIAMVLLFAASIWKMKGIRKMLVIIFAIRFFLDFDMQFLAMVYIGIAFLDWKDGKKFTVSFDSGVLFAISQVLPLIFLVISVQIGGASLCYYRGNYSMASKIYPYDWEYQLYLMKSSGQPEESASKIVSLNPYCSEAWQLLSDAAVENGDYRTAVSDAVKSARYDSADSGKMAKAYKLILFAIENETRQSSSETSEDFKSSSNARKSSVAWYTGKLEELCDLSEEVMNRKNPFCRKAGYTVYETDLLNQMKKSLAVIYMKNSADIS